MKTTVEPAAIPEPDLHLTYYEALGRVVVDFQALEEGITFSLLRLTRPQLTEDIFDKAYFLALSELSFKSRLKLLRNLIEKATVNDYLFSGNQSPSERAALFEELLRQLKETSQKCEGLEDKRNQLIHSVWRPSESEPDRTALRYKVRVQAKRTAFALEKIPLADVKQLVADLRAARETISRCSEVLCSVLLEKHGNAV